MKNNKGQAITTAYKALHKELTEADITPILQYLDSETSIELIASIKKKESKISTSCTPRSSIEPSRKSSQHIQEPLHRNLGQHHSHHQEQK